MKELTEAQKRDAGAILFQTWFNQFQTYRENTDRNYLKLIRTVAELNELRAPGETAGPRARGLKPQAPGSAEIRGLYYARTSHVKGSTSDDPISGGIRLWLFGSASEQF